MSNSSSSQKYESHQSDPDAFIGPGNTNLGPGPVIPDSIPAAPSTAQSSSNPSHPGGQTQSAFTGHGGVHLGHGPRVDHLSKNEDGTLRLGGDHSSTQQGQQHDAEQASPDGQKNPWRGPGGMKLGHGPRVDHLPKDSDGNYRLASEHNAAEGSVGSGHVD